MSNNFIRRFDIDLSYLTKEEIEMLGKLIQAVELTSKVYAQQKADGFYPQGVTQIEIEKATAKEPSILSPYTMVERDENGELMAIPYHKKYRQLLLPIAKLLTEAAQIPTTHNDFRRALLAQAKSLLNGEYDKAEIAWLKIEPYLLDVVIGPLERIEDNLFFVKRSYQAWVGVMDKNVTDRINGLKEIVFSARRQVLPSEGVDFMKKAQLRADNTIIFSGMISQYTYTATTLPNDIDMLEKYGSEGWIFLPQVRKNFEECQYPLFNVIFADFFKSSFTRADLFRGYQLMIVMHEIARIVVRYRFAVDRLKEMWPIFNELAVEALAVKLMGTLLLKDVISQKEMEASLVMFITRLFDGYMEAEEDKVGTETLVTGNAILLNSLIDKGSIRVTKEGISWPNFTKMYISVSELADGMEKILAEGTYTDAQSYLKKHSSLSVFKKFSSALKALQNC